MAGGGSKPGQRRGGRKEGSKNKPKPENALVQLPDVEAEADAILAPGEPMTTLGKDRLAQIDAWAYRLAELYAPKRKKEGGSPYWETPGDEARWFRCITLSQKCADGRANYESPRLAAMAVAQQQIEDPYEDIDPHQKLIDAADRWIAAKEAERAAKMIDVTPNREQEVIEVKPEPEDIGDGEAV